MRAFIGHESHWRGITAVTLAGAGAVVAAIYAVMAMVILMKEK